MNHSTLIKNGQIIDNTWQYLGLPEEQTAAQVTLPATGDFLFAPALWQAHKNEIISRYKRIGLWLEPSDTLEALVPDLHYFQVIAVNFPKFVDGRGYSTARLLRERFHYEGEIRAVGDILQDQLFFMSRVGFDAFALKEGKDPSQALKALHTFKNPYQGAVDNPFPLFRREHS